MSGTDAETNRSDTLVEALRVLRRRWPVVFGCIALCVVAAVGLHARKNATYEATTNVAFGIANLSDTALQVAQGGSNPERDAATNVLIAKSPAVAQSVAGELKIATDPHTLAGDVKVEAAPNANVLNITAKAADPATAQRIANAFAKQYIAFSARSQIEGIDSAERTLREQLAALPPSSQRAASVSSSLQRLAQLRAVANGDARIIGLAGAGVATGMGVSLTVLLGLLIGAALGATVAFVLEALDRRATRIEDFEREYRLPALAAVPQSSFRAPGAVERRGGLEPYRILRSALSTSTADREVFTVLLTSAVPGEGKTSAAIDLAQAVALTGRSVTLVELDLRRPTFSRHFDIDPRRGVTSVLWGRATLDDVLVRPFADLPNLAVVPSGQLPPNPSELLASPEIEQFLTRLTYLGEGTQRMIVIDAPPLLAVADTQVLLDNPAIDRVLVVARAGKTTYDEIRRARAVLDRHLLQPVGLVVAGTSDIKEYGYGSEQPESADRLRPESRVHGPDDAVIGAPGRETAAARRTEA